MNLAKALEFKSDSGNTYVYDDISGHIFHTTEIIKKYRNLSTSCINAKLDVSTNDIKFALYNLGIGFKQLLLEVTSICNFRCKYCTYSDHYDLTRSHGKNNMDFVIAKKAIDYYFENFKIIYKRNAQKKPIISFYGGEPLINFSLIKEVVNYIKNIFPQFEVDYHITTNGFLMDKDVQKFLYDNNFFVLLSLDGDKDNNDRNRVTINGNKVFDKVFTNYTEFKNTYPDTKIFISACYDYKTNFDEIMDFFDQNKIRVIQMSPIDSNSNTYYNQFSSEDRLNYLNNINNIKNYMK